MGQVFEPGFVPDPTPAFANETWPQAIHMATQLRRLDQFADQLNHPLGDWRHVNGPIAPAVDGSDLAGLPYHYSPLWREAYAQAAAVEAIATDVSLSRDKRVDQLRTQVRDDVEPYTYSKISRAAPTSWRPASGNAFVPAIYGEFFGTTPLVVNGLHHSGSRFESFSDPVSAVQEALQTAEQFSSGAVADYKQGRFLHPPENLTAPYPPVTRADQFAQHSVPRRWPVDPLFQTTTYAAQVEIKGARGWFHAFDGSLVWRNDLRIHASAGGAHFQPRVFSVPPGTSWRELGGNVSTTEEYEAEYVIDEAGFGPFSFYWGHGPQPIYDLFKTGTKLATLGSRTTVDWSPLYDVRAPDTDAHYYVSYTFGFDLVDFGFPPLVHANCLFGADAPTTDLPNVVRQSTVGGVSDGFSVHVIYGYDYEHGFRSLSNPSESGSDRIRLDSLARPDGVPIPSALVP